MTDITGFTIAVGLVATTVDLGVALLFVDLRGPPLRPPPSLHASCAAPIIRADDR